MEKQDETWGEFSTLGLGVLEYVLQWNSTLLKCLNNNIYSYLETSGGQSSNPYLNAVHFFNTRVKQKSVAA